MNAKNALSQYLLVVENFNNAASQNGVAVIREQMKQDLDVVDAMNTLSSSSSVGETMINRVVASCVYALWSDAEFRVWQKHENKANVLSETMATLKEWDKLLFAFVPICLDKYMDEIAPVAFLNRVHDEKVAQWRRNHVV